MTQQDDLELALNLLETHQFSGDGSYDPIVCCPQCGGRPGPDKDCGHVAECDIAVLLRRNNRQTWFKGEPK